MRWDANWRLIWLLRSWCCCEAIWARANHPRQRHRRGLSRGVSGGRHQPYVYSRPRYRGARVNLYHIDLYRVDTPRQLETLGLDDLIGENSVLSIEWGRKVSALRARVRCGDCVGASQRERAEGESDLAWEPINRARHPLLALRTEFLFTAHKGNLRTNARIAESGVFRRVLSVGGY